MNAGQFFMNLLKSFLQSLGKLFSDPWLLGTLLLSVALVGGCSNISGRIAGRVKQRRIDKVQIERLKGQISSLKGEDIGDQGGGFFRRP